MSRSVTIAAGQTNVQLPNGYAYNAGQTVTLTDAQFAQIPTADFPSIVIDGGASTTPGDQVVTQGADVTNLVTNTAVPPVALTSAAPAAITSTAPSATYVQAEATAVRADVVALQATVAALRADLVTMRTNQAAIVTDLGAHSTTINALDNNLTGPGKALV